jgi:hypothetical protein
MALPGQGRGPARTTPEVRILPGTRAEIQDVVVTTGAPNDGYGTILLAVDGEARTIPPTLNRPACRAARST